VSPDAAVERHLGRDGAAAVLRLSGGGVRRHAGPVRVAAVGKAAARMADAAGAVLGDLIERGLVVVPRGGGQPATARLECMHGSHPVPDDTSAAAADALLDLARTTPRGTLLLVLLSGGASALVAAPVAGLELRDVQLATAALLASGADIQAVNTVRRHCSRLKGGGLLRAAAGAAAVWTLALSDVIGDEPAAIGSGPTAPDPTTFGDAAAILERWVPGAPGVLGAVLAEGVAGRREETVKPGDPLLRRATFVVVGSNVIAVDALAAAAGRAGYRAERLAQPIAGDAARAGEALGRRLRDPSAAGGRVALVGGGEPTVQVVPGGRGGRAQQLALAAAPVLAGTRCLLLAAGTDGIDGPTDAAGAWVDGGTMAEAGRLGLDVAAALAATDAHPVLARLGALVRTGPTGTNVADVVLGLRA
jgi:glycerate 2-kinase